MLKLIILKSIEMKKILLLTALLFSIILTNYGQTNPYFQNMNIISWDEFTNISFNGISLGEIMRTKGNPVKVDSLFGMTMKIEKSKDPNYYWINFISTSLSFTFDESVTSPAALSNLDVASNTVAVMIGGKIIHIGDSIDKLGNVKILTGTDGSKSIEFLSESADDQWVSIEFDQTTKIITKIFYLAT